MSHAIVRLATSAAEDFCVVDCTYGRGVGRGDARMEELIVDDKARGTGAGMTLVKAAIERAKRRGCNLITLYSREHTRAFYEKAGFRYVGPELHRAID